MDLVMVVRESMLYRSLARLRKWSRHSRAVAIMTSERFQEAVIAVVLLASSVSIFRSDANAAVKFLSFALLFVLTVVVTWSLTDPFSE